MNLLVFQPTNDTQEFINLWSQVYRHSNAFEDNYTNHIKPDKPSTDRDILKLFEWLTVAGLGRVKTATIKEKVFPHLDYINDMKFENTVNLDEFQKKFSGISAISRIMLLHIIKPNVYPLYDTNIHVAYNNICGIDTKSHPFTKSEEAKMTFYFEAIIPFVASIKGSNSIKKIDQALNAYGQMVRKIEKSALTF